MLFTHVGKAAAPLGVTVDGDGWGVAAAEVQAPPGGRDADFDHDQSTSFRATHTPLEDGLYIK